VTASTRMINMLLVVSVIISGAVASLAQQANMNLEGLIRDETTGAPVGVKIYIFTPSGKRISINSNSKDGSYLQTLAESGPHKVAIAGYNVYRKEETIDIPASEKFKIIKRDITVKSLVQGAEVLQSSGMFSKNTASLTPQGLKTLEELSALMKTNQSMNIVLTLAADEDKFAAAIAAVDAAYRKEHDAWAKACKKVKKGQPLPTEPVRQANPEDPNKALVQERIDTLKARLRPVKNGDVRLRYIYEASPVQQIQPAVAVSSEPVAKAGKQKGSAAQKSVPIAKTPKVVTLPQLVARIGVVKDLMD